MIRLTPPTVIGEVSSGWGQPRSYRGGWHAGLDFPAPKGSPLLASADGIVAFVRDYEAGDYAGKFMVIDHGGGIVSRYLHNDTNLKRVGDYVSRGDKIGTVGTTGTKYSAPHVHFDIKLSPSALERFKEEYGTPTTGFSKKMRWGVGVPAETFMDDAKYRAGVIQSSLKRGVKLYESKLSWLLWGSLAVAAGWLASRFIRR